MTFNEYWNLPPSAIGFYFVIACLVLAALYLVHLRDQIKKGK